MVRTPDIDIYIYIILGPSLGLPLDVATKVTRTPALFPKYVFPCKGAM